jgi:hypothetical protein
MNPIKQWGSVMVALILNAIYRQFLRRLSTRDAHAPDPWLKAAMRDPKIATPYILAVAGIAVAIWAKMGSPPKAHPVSITHQFAGPPS